MLGLRIATSPSFRTAPRNDTLYDTISTYFIAKGIENLCHCEPVRTLAWQSVPPMRSIVSARRAVNVTP